MKTLKETLSQTLMIHFLFRTCSEVLGFLSNDFPLITPLSHRDLLPPPPERLPPPPERLPPPPERLPPPPERLPPPLDDLLLLDVLLVILRLLLLWNQGLLYHGDP